MRPRWLSRLWHRRLLARLKAIELDTTKILADASPSIGGPVNWGCLVCFGAEQWRDECGHTGVRVWITEAGPSAGDLQDYVHEALRNRGWGPVEIRTEW